MSDIRARLEAEKVAEREKYEKNYGEILAHVRKSIAEKECICAIAHAAYLVRLGDLRIAVDPNLWLTPEREECFKALVSLLSECDAVVITHAHSDHYTPSLLKALPSNISLYIPSFVAYEGENVIRCDDGTVKTQGDVTFTFFESLHYKDRSLRECGFALTRGGKNYVFPADVRLYDAPHAVFPNTEVLVSHLWLGRATACDPDACDPAAFCRFVNSHHAAHVLVSHLNDHRRDTEFFWSDAHYEMVQAQIEGESVPFHFGDVYCFKA